MRCMRIALLLSLILCCSGSIMAQSFTYQGMLKTSGIPANGNHDFQFSLWTAASGGSQVGSTLTRTGVSVQSGLFTQQLDFGAVWDGSDRYLQIAVRLAGSGSYTTLWPRVRVTPTPYAVYALNAPWGGISGMPEGFADGIDNDTTYSAGAGLALTGTTFSIAAGGVATSMLQDLAVTTVKVADGAVTGAKIADGTIGTADIASGAVTDAKLSGTGVTAGTYGSATQVGVFTVNAQGRVTSANNVTISGVTPGGSAGGDLSGTYPNPTVVGLQTRPVSSSAPNSGQVLKWNGSAWSPAVDDVGGLTLPFSGNANVEGTAFSVTNTATSGNTFGVHGVSNSPEGTGVYGFGGSVGMFGHSNSTSGRGVIGYAAAAGGEAWGVHGRSDSTSGAGVYGWASAPSGMTTGVLGGTSSPYGYGVLGIGGSAGVWGESSSPVGNGVVGWASATSGDAWGVVGLTSSTSGVGVYGHAAATSGNTFGVHGVSNSTSGRGVFGLATAASGTTYGVLGVSYSTSGLGVHGHASATSGNTTGVFGGSDSTSGRGVFGWASATSGITTGVSGVSNSPEGLGVYGFAHNVGVFGASDSASGRGVIGYASATSGEAWGVHGRSDSTSGAGVFGWASAPSGNTYGVLAGSESTSGYGVWGWASAPSGFTTGVIGGTSSPSGYGVVGIGGSVGVFGQGEYGVYSNGDFAATGTKSFQIDHPLEPENAYLNHYCTEGPEPYNVYCGNIVTDARGYALVQLPDYFESINRDFRYQLTVIDSSDDFVLAKVVREIQNNQFVVRTSKPFVKVSWEVKATRNDRWVQEYGFQTEQEKEEDLKGKYVHPELYGQPKELGIHYRSVPEREQPVKQ